MPQLRFSTRIYKKQAVQKAILAYSRLAKFTVEENKRYTIVKAHKIDREVRSIFFDEFANYVLGEN